MPSLNSTPPEGKTHIFYIECTRLVRRAYPFDKDSKELSFARYIPLTIWILTLSGLQYTTLGFLFSELSYEKVTTQRQARAS